MHVRNVSSMACTERHAGAQQASAHMESTIWRSVNSAIACCCPKLLAASRAPPWAAPLCRRNQTGLICNGCISESRCHKHAPKLVWSGDDGQSGSMALQESSACPPASPASLHMSAACTARPDEFSARKARETLQNQRCLHLGPGVARCCQAALPAQAATPRAELLPCRQRLRADHRAPHPSPGPQRR